MSKPIPIETVFTTVHGYDVVIEIFRTRPRGFRGRWSCCDLPARGGSGVVSNDINQVIAANKMNAYAGVGGYLHKRKDFEEPTA
jgi:hypothetical protein